MTPTTKVVHECRDTSHAVVIGTAGAVDVQWITRGREKHYKHSFDQVAFFSADNEDHTRIMRSAGVPSSSYILKLPPMHLIGLAKSDEVRMPDDCPHFMLRDDSVLSDCLSRLASPVGHIGEQDIGREILAHRLVLRLVELLGGRRPEWVEDASVFSAVVMSQIVEYIDSRMAHHISLEEIGLLVRLSPSHCAKKFRGTAGESLGRFINRRRLAQSLVTLKSDATTLTRVALDLGFSSQSHFTRLFSDLTGMTPAKYRKQFKRTVG
jgi:AraC family transcriptional regulator